MVLLPFPKTPSTILIIGIILRCALIIIGPAFAVPSFCGLPSSPGWRAGGLAGRAAGRRRKEGRAMITQNTPHPFMQWGAWCSRIMGIATQHRTLPAKEGSRGSVARYPPEMGERVRWLQAASSFIAQANETYRSIYPLIDHRLEWMKWKWQAHRWRERTGPKCSQQNRSNLAGPENSGRQMVRLVQQEQSSRLMLRPKIISSGLPFGWRVADGSSSSCDLPKTEAHLFIFVGWCLLFSPHAQHPQLKGKSFAFKISEMKHFYILRRRSTVFWDSFSHRQPIPPSPPSCYGGTLCDQCPRVHLWPAVAARCCLNENMLR